jgi:hypothetical protein
MSELREARAKCGGEKLCGFDTAAYSTSTTDVRRHRRRRSPALSPLLRGVRWWRCISPRTPRDDLLAAERKRGYIAMEVRVANRCLFVWHTRGACREKNPEEAAGPVLDETDQNRIQEVALLSLFDN